MDVLLVTNKSRQNTQLDTIERDDAYQYRRIGRHLLYPGIVQGEVPVETSCFRRSLVPSARFLRFGSRQYPMSHNVSSQFLAKTEDLSLTNCDREPIHRPGRIQPFGYLLAGAIDLGRIDYASENYGDLLEDPNQDIFGLSFSDVIGRQIVHDIRNTLMTSTVKRQRERVCANVVNGKEYEVFVHLNPQEQVVIELERLDVVESQSGHSHRLAIDKVRVYLAKAAEQTDIVKLLNVCVHGLRELTGYDRIKAYRYFSNGDGEVVAESRSMGVDSFLGLRFPSWDVPKQARALQLKNPLRMLSSVTQEPIALESKSFDASQLDISLAHLRGISPIHVEYLQNMGVGATLTIGLVVDGRLWGMFSCHHRTPKIISSDLRIAVELFGQLVSLLIHQKLELVGTEARARAVEARRQILQETDATKDLLHAFPTFTPILKDMIGCDGLAVVRDKVVQRSGSTPSQSAILEIAKRKAHDEDLLETTDNLKLSGWCNKEGLGESAGCLQLRCTAAYPLQMLFFRDRKARGVSWAGAPEKHIEEVDNVIRLTPRGSFAAYVEEQKDYAPDWESKDIEASKHLQVLLTQITAKGERAQMERHKDLVTHQRQQDLMIAELNHRVKNILALIRSLSRQAKSSSSSLEAYAQALEQRIAALAVAHDLAVSNTMQGVSLIGLLETELQPYLTSENSQALVSGPLVGLRSDVAPMIALVMHEIVSNAVKYGALSTASGIVTARWRVDDNGLHFHWQELNGPKVSPPTRHGFGRSLVEKAIPYEFDGKSSLEYPESGVVFTFSLPQENLVDLETKEELKIVGSVATIEEVASGSKVLVVEDTIVLAMDLIETLTRLGAESVDTAATTQEALAQISQNTYDFGVLDMNLRGEVSFSIAQKLAALDIPFVFVTGYGSHINLPPELEYVEILTKPIDEGSLSFAIKKLRNA